jgi:hypothetical protein
MVGAAVEPIARTMKSKRKQFFFEKKNQKTFIRWAGA